MTPAPADPALTALRAHVRRRAALRQFFRLAAGVALSLALAAGAATVLGYWLKFAGLI